MSRQRHRNNAECPAAGDVMLEAARSGDRMEILEIPDEHARITALRFGMAEGALVSCTTRIPAGPIVLSSGRQEVAIGRGLARRIRVRHIGRQD